MPKVYEVTSLSFTTIKYIHRFIIKSLDLLQLTHANTDCVPPFIVERNVKMQY